MMHSFQDSLPFETSTPSFTPSITPYSVGWFAYYASSSVIMRDRFALKFSYEGRSYLIKGVYRIMKIRSIMEGNANVIVDAIRISEIYAYQWGRYVHFSFQTRDRLKFERAIARLLENPRFNQNLAN